ncbi:response regulator transcription factor [Dactylosporangium darangshiense]|uniref:Response regulator transcription factor n=1 Tax=Dactylosporangium darangshiense TaxID=579108 RepID=A0ABP8DU14_9ACTN
MMLRVSIVSEPSMWREQLVQTVSQDPVFELESVVRLVEELPVLPNELRVVALDLPRQPSVPALARIAAAAQVGRVLVSSAWDSRPTLLAAVRAGARACLTRDSESDITRSALRAVALGSLYVCPLLVERFNAELVRPSGIHPNGLAEREFEALRWIALGYTPKQIADRMNLHRKTVNAYTRSIRTKVAGGEVRAGDEQGLTADARPIRDTAVR